MVRPHLGILTTVAMSSSGDGNCRSGSQTALAAGRDDWNNGRTLVARSGWHSRRGGSRTAPTVHRSKNRSDGLRDPIGPGDVELFERRAERYWRVWRRHDFDRSVEQVKSLVGDERGDVGRDTAARVILIDDHEVMRLLHRGKDGVFVEWRNRARIDD